MHIRLITMKMKTKMNTYMIVLQYFLFFFFPICFVWFIVGRGIVVVSYFWKEEPTILLEITPFLGWSMRINHMLFLHREIYCGPTQNLLLIIYVVHFRAWMKIRAPTIKKSFKIKPFSINWIIIYKRMISRKPSY